MKNTRYRDSASITGMEAKMIINSLGRLTKSSNNGKPQLHRQTEWLYSFESPVKCHQCKEEFEGQLLIISKPKARPTRTSRIQTNVYCLECARQFHRTALLKVRGQ